MATTSSRIVDSAFGHPRGLLGRIGGVIMARAGAATERELVAEAGLRQTDTVLVLGPGSGEGQTGAGHVRLHREDAERTGLPDGSVDVVLAVHALHRWPDRDRALAELYRVLRPGGRLVLSAHRMLVAESPATLRLDVECAGFTRVLMRLNERRGLLGPSYELTARRPLDR